MNPRKILRRLTSPGTRRKLAFAVVSARRPTSALRPLPNLLVIGGQRCGTSSLFKYLGSHPQVKASIRKEVRFFTEFHARGVGWYRSHFPLAPAGLGRAPIYFEATPDYLLDPRAAERATGLLPDVRIVALLRDPVERAFSHYCHNRRLGTESLGFREALEREGERIGPALLRIQADPTIPTPKALLRYSYVERGRYATHLERWKRFVDEDRMLILRSEDFFEDPNSVYQRILQFLEIRAWKPEAYRNFSFASSRPEPPPLPPQCADWLVEALTEEMERLPDVLGPKAPLFDYRTGWAGLSR